MGVQLSASGITTSFVGRSASYSCNWSLLRLASAAGCRPTPLQYASTDASSRFEIGVVLIECLFQVRTACFGRVVTIRIMLVFVAVNFCSNGQL